jgi:redox-sensitive bicupin YhaK (pirin superfamily)
VTQAATATRQYIILKPEDHAALGESEFGMPGLLAIESIGPFTEIEASGPLITVHDATVDAGLGIGHHPHRFNERLFYIERGQLDHDDTANHIQGHMAEGDVGQFTEGQRGMLHSEWNHGDIGTRAYILVYSTDPVPAAAAFHVLSDDEAPRYDDGAVHTKELVGPKSPLEVNGDIRLFTDDRLDAGAQVQLQFGAGEGGLVSVREGSVRISGHDEPLGAGVSIVVPPAEEPGALAIEAEEASRIIRVVHGAGHGFIRGTPRLQTRTRIPS